MSTQGATSLFIYQGELISSIRYPSFSQSSLGVKTMKGHQSAEVFEEAVLSGVHSTMVVMFSV